MLGIFYHICGGLGQPHCQLQSAHLEHRDTSVAMAGTMVPCWDAWPQGLMSCSLSMNYMQAKEGCKSAGNDSNTQTKYNPE